MTSTLEQRRSVQRPEHLRELHLAYAATRDRDVEAALVAAYTALAMHLADLHGRGGDDLADARQVALFGLLQALRRWDPAREVAFSTFAWATIKGELKRHRRDTAWDLHVSRSVQEAHLRTASAVEELSHELGRAPTIDEIGNRTGDPPERVLAAVHARNARSVRSLDAPRPGHDEDIPQVGVVDDRFEDLDDGALVQTLLARLPPIEREVIRLRFAENLTQTQIGERMGMSQIHVSRLLTRILDRLRAVAAAGACMD
jgi:RNA polymerase sigma-B factor